MKLIGVGEFENSFNIISIDDNAICLKNSNSKYLAKIKIPFESSPELASLIGHVFGDGHIKGNLNQFDYVNKNFDLIKEVNEYCKSVFGLEGKINYRKDRNIYETYFPSVIAKILFLCGAPKGRKSIQDFSVPEWIVKGRLEIKKSFLRALFDDEGWVGITQGNFAIGFGQNKKEHLIESHKKYLEQIRFMIEEFGMKTSGIFHRSQKGDSIQLGFKIIGPLNLQKFLNEICFTHKLKQCKLKQILNQYKQIQFSKKEAKLKLWEMLRKGSIKSRELGILLNRDQKTVWKHLHKLHKKNLVRKIGTKNKVFWEINYLNNINSNIKQ